MRSADRDPAREDDPDDADADTGTDLLARRRDEAEVGQRPARAAVASTTYAATQSPAHSPDWLRTRLGTVSGRIPAAVGDLRADQGADDRADEPEDRDPEALDVVAGRGRRGDRAGRDGDESRRRRARSRPPAAGERVGAREW